MYLSRTQVDMSEAFEIGYSPAFHTKAIGPLQDAKRDWGVSLLWYGSFPFLFWTTYPW